MEFQKGDRVRRKEGCGDHGNVREGDIVIVSSSYGSALYIEGSSYTYDASYFDFISSAEDILSSQTESYEIY